jgi:hypothetical protein
MDGEDPRLVPGAYVTQDGHLYEVLYVSPATIQLENCRSGVLVSTCRSSLQSTYRLVKPAPTVPDTPADVLSC